MMSTNPYQPPSALDDDDDVPRHRGARELTYESPSEVIAPLRETRPWVKLVSVVGFVFSILMIVLGVFLVAFSDDTRIPTWIELAYAFGGAIYLYPCMYLWRYAAAIQTHLRARDADSLAAALGHQKSFWKFAGALTLLVLAGYAILIVGVVFFAFVKHAPHR